jgi:hypothetical protein
MAESSQNSSDAEEMDEDIVKLMEAIERPPGDNESGEYYFAVYLAVYVLNYVCT